MRGNGPAKAANSIVDIYGFSRACLYSEQVDARGSCALVSDCKCRRMRDLEVGWDVMGGVS